jgi:meso-butanediol dehydrogenase / (S,S)-butanediol dehydrogenase / diacetyl reductase
MDRCLEGRVALVTGAGHGIGRASALALAEAGAFVAVTDKRLGAAEETAKALADAGADGKPYQVDVTQADELGTVVDQLVADHGHVDILHANAGVLIAGTALSQTIGDWDATYGVNVRGTFLTVRAVLPHMQRQNRGAIIISASISGMIGEPSLVAYNSSKGALINLTRQLAVEYAANQIRVNCICPGWIETGFNDPVLGHLSPAELEDLIAQQVPLGRQGTPEDIAPGVVFLASDNASYITGQSLVIDGGLTSK